MTQSNSINRSARGALVTRRDEGNSSESNRIINRFYQRIVYVFNSFVFGGEPPVHAEARILETRPQAMQVAQLAGPDQTVGEDLLVEAEPVQVMTAQAVAQMTPQARSLFLSLLSQMPPEARSLFCSFPPDLRQRMLEEGYDTSIIIAVFNQAATEYHHTPSQ